MKKILIRVISSLVPNKNLRRKIRKRLSAGENYITHFSYKVNGQKKKIHLFEHQYNCGFIGERMTERSIEIPMAKFWLEKNDDVFEIGATTPYYFDLVSHVCDPFDSHPKVDHRCSMFDLNLEGKNILSISTIEHIASGDYGVEIKQNESATLAFEKIMKESNKALVTFPVGYNKDLDEYFINKEYEKLNKDLNIMAFGRKIAGNRWKQIKIEEISNYSYGPNTANAIVVVEKR